MQEVFEKIIEKLEKKVETAKRIMVPEIQDELDRIANETAESFIEAYKESIEIVKKVAAEYNDGWIPADKLPKDNKYVLLCFENFSLPLVGRYEADGEGGGTYYIGDCDEEDTCISNDLYVNAWQPLPDPYHPKGE